MKWWHNLGIEPGEPQIIFCLGSKITGNYLNFKNAFIK